MSAGSATVVGLVPAAGVGSRLADVEGSKEALPVWEGFGPPGAPRPAALCLLAAFAAAGVERAFVILRAGKWDVPRALADATERVPPLAWLLVGRSPGLAWTLDRARPFVADATVVMGFPDILFRPRDAVARLVRGLRAGEADLVLGCFPPSPDRRADSLELAADGRVRALASSDGPAVGPLTWCLAAWGPRFTEVLAEAAGAARATVPEAGGSGREVPLGEVIEEARRGGLRVHGLRVSDEPFLDIGTPAGLAEARRRVPPRSAPGGP